MSTCTSITIITITSWDVRFPKFQKTLKVLR